MVRCLWRFAVCRLPGVAVAGCVAGFLRVVWGLFGGVKSEVVSSLWSVGGLSVRVVQMASGRSGLRDDVLVTSFDDADPGCRFVRVAVFDPAENFSLPDGRLLGHRAVSTARSWLRALRDPVVALAAANRELHSPLVPSDLNPMTTVVFADVRVGEDGVEVLCAGRCADGHCVVWADGGVVELLSAPMLVASAQERWDVARLSVRGLAHAGGGEWASLRWLLRGSVLGVEDWVNPSVGLLPVLSPELCVGPRVVDRVLLATDGLEPVLDGVWDPYVAFEGLRSRSTPSGMSWPHGDVAFVDVTVAG